MRKIGVGPHPKPWPDEDYYDKDLLRDGDTRNVVDKYRYWKNDAIKQDMIKNSSSFEIAIENYQHDFNIGTIVRNANAFGVGKVHIIGKRHWNKRGAMVTNKYIDVVHHAYIKDFLDCTKELYHIAVDNLPGSVDVLTVSLPENTVFIFGGEGPGLSDEMIRNSNKMVKIQQFGSTRSVNVGVASGIVMHEWIRQHKLIDKM